MRLLKIQNELKVPKSQFNKFGNYKYRNCDDIFEEAKPICLKHGALLTVTDEIVFIEGRYYVKATAMVNTGKEVASCHGYAREPDAQKGMADAQVTGSSSSYARKYALNGLFLLDDTKDADSQDNRNSEKPVKPEPKKKTYKNFEFLNQMKTMKEILGNDKYYGLLSKHNFEHANNIPPDNQAAALKAFNSLVDSIEGKGT